MLTEISSTTKSIKNVLFNDPTSKIINYLKEESRKQAKRGIMLMSLTTNLFFPQQLATANVDA